MNKAVEAFARSEVAVKGNAASTGATLLLHESGIAWRDARGWVFASLAGYPTATTRRYLNDLCSLIAPDCAFYQAGGKQFFRDRAGIVNEITSTQLVNLIGPTAFAR